MNIDTLPPRLVMRGGPIDGAYVELADPDDADSPPEHIRIEGRAGWYVPSDDPEVYVWEPWVS